MICSKFLKLYKINVVLRSDTGRFVKKRHVGVPLVGIPYTRDTAVPLAPKFRISIVRVDNE